MEAFHETVTVSQRQRKTFGVFHGNGGVAGGTFFLLRCTFVVFVLCVCLLLAVEKKEKVVSKCTAPHWCSHAA